MDVLVFAPDVEPKPLIDKKVFEVSRWIKFLMKALI